jgi:hypothetical protein
LKQFESFPHKISGEAGTFFTTLLEGFQKVANRIATGLVLAALIVGATSRARKNRA